MSREADNPHYVRRVVLPSGKTIEVVYFDELPAFPAVGDSSRAETGDDLHLCGTCGSDLVYPVDWDEAGATLSGELVALLTTDSAPVRVPVALGWNTTDTVHEEPAAMVVPQVLVWV